MHTRGDSEMLSWCPPPVLAWWVEWSHHQLLTGSEELNELNSPSIEVFMQRSCQIKAATWSAEEEASQCCRPGSAAQRSDVRVKSRLLWQARSRLCYWCKSIFLMNIYGGGRRVRIRSGLTSSPHWNDQRILCFVMLFPTCLSMYVSFQKPLKVQISVMN